MLHHLFPEAQQSRPEPAIYWGTIVRTLCAFTGIALLLGSVFSCGAASDSTNTVLSKPAHPTPVQAVTHYAQQMARRARFTTPTSRQYGNGTISYSDSTSFTVVLSDYTVQVYMNREQQPETVFISAYHPAPTSDTAQNRVVYPAPPDQLTALGNLRHVFGQGKQGPVMEVKEASWQNHPVLFDYHPSPNGRQVQIRATMPAPNYTDSSMIHSIMLSAYEQ
ncbi:hypothetical protein K3G63_03510 [Hymenobacter sp. HSC-4F20]|uniref:hypothetical protein n=1 Tax=Hymenobacter sp. HSC-4F20 TaxID=2864135 RepID=UPI001C736E05|nr:hypothetical protein [Hymenobacter sp. HSC-4F20]MBX0289487.1 hypothetical protein [Hymenobacter sp. HSC-4F20]